MRFRSRHPRLLFRSYLLLVGGLLLAAVVLDLGFGHLQSRLTPSEDRWLERTFRLIEAELAAAAPESRVAAAARLAREMGVGVQIFDEDDVVAAAPPADDIAHLTDAGGSISYLRRAPSIAGSIRLGPVEAHRESVVMRLLPSLFYLSVFIVVSVWLRPLLRDLDLMTRGAQQFAADYRKPLATAAHTTQLTSLALNLDEMSARLGSLIQSQKELTAALSHEMRTPLARIRFALAVVDRNGGDALDGQLAAINADVQEIDDLIAAILNYARLDHPDLRMSWQPTPIDGWLELTLEKYRGQGKEIEATRDPGSDTVWMDPRLMALALSNLVDNACRYARRKVKVTVVSSEHGYRLTVEDDGAGIPESARDSVFKAFTRLDTSRNRDTGGHGLGLAIVARIAALHGGSAAAHASETLGGARLTLQWANVCSD